MTDTVDKNTSIWSNIGNYCKRMNRLFRRKEKQLKKKEKFQKTENYQKTVVETKINNTPVVTTKASQVAGTKAAPVYTPCHKGNVALFKVNDATLYAGGWTRGAKSAGCVTIDLTGTEYRWNKTVCAENSAGEIAFKRTLGTIPTREKSDALAWLSMPIVDYGTPDWTTETWLNLAIDVFDVLNKGNDVLIACTGGHGRTGLAISILLYMLAVVPKDTNPVEYVRKIYCDDAVETYAQENYVYSILGLPFKATYTKYVSNRGAWNGSYWYDDDYYGYEKANKFGYCTVCKEYKWLTKDVCVDCQDWLDKKERDEETQFANSFIGTCPYCGDEDVALVDYNGDAICSKCQDWSKLRAAEIAKKGVSVCSYCGDNIDTPFLYYNSDLICEKCYTDLYATGLTSEIIDTTDKGKIIRLTTSKDNEEPKNEVSIV